MIKNAGMKRENANELAKELVKKYDFASAKYSLRFDSD